MNTFSGLLTLDIDSLSKKTVLSKVIKKESRMILRNYRIETTTSSEKMAWVYMGLQDDERIPIGINGQVTIRQPNYEIKLKDDIVNVIETLVECNNFERLTLQFEIIS